MNFHISAWLFWIGANVSTRCGFYRWRRRSNTFCGITVEGMIGGCGMSFALCPTCWACYVQTPYSDALEVHFGPFRLIFFK